MTGDGITDDSFPLQQDMEARSAQGGAVYFLRAAPGSSFFFAHSVAGAVEHHPAVGQPDPAGQARNLHGPGRAGRSGQTLRLAADAPQGATTLSIDTSPAGGGPVSSFLAPCRLSS